MLARNLISLIFMVSESKVWHGDLKSRLESLGEELVIIHGVMLSGCRDIESVNDKIYSSV